MKLTPFHDLLNQLSSVAENTFEAAVTEDWMQGRSSFGGLSATLASTAMRSSVAPERQLRSLQVSFVGPVAEGKQIITVENLREGGSVSHRQATIKNGEETSLVATAAYGAGRPSAYAVATEERPEIIGPEDLDCLPFIPKVTPNFTQHFEMRWAKGQFPFTGAPKADYWVWVKMKSPAPADEAGLIALADALPPPALSLPDKPCPGSSLSWYLELLPHAEPQGQLDDWWLIHYGCDAGQDAYFNQMAKIWAPNGKLVAISRQVAMVFA